jgi:hypothetical protein
MSFGEIKRPPDKFGIERSTTCDTARTGGLEEISDLSVEWVPKARLLLLETWCGYGAALKPAWSASVSESSPPPALLRDN